jgi:hypothetical protein
MTEKTITTLHYKLYPSPRNRYREVFAHQVFVPHPYALIDLPSLRLQGKATLYGACRLSDMKMGQVVTLELAEDVAQFHAQFVPD